MTSDVLSALVKDAKEDLRKKKNIFDREIESLILACEADLLHRNAIQADQLNSLPIDPLIHRAIMTYCKAYFGDNEEKSWYKADYDEQKATLMTTTGFTDWGDIDG